uniref:Uncharacterized protein n=1 Tax=Opuntia streptacantha TaxID=393608 RepID=A0A7C9A4N3_OPUST
MTLRRGNPLIFATFTFHKTRSSLISHMQFFYESSVLFHQERHLFLEAHSFNSQLHDQPSNHLCPNIYIICSCQFCFFGLSHRCLQAPQFTPQKGQFFIKLCIVF